MQLWYKISLGYCGKISRYLDTDKKRFSRMKSHDCHVMVTQILPIALRGIKEKHGPGTLIGLWNLFDGISRKSISSPSALPESKLVPVTVGG